MKFKTVVLCLKLDSSGLETPNPEIHYVRSCYYYYNSHVKCQ